MSDKHVLFFSNFCKYSKDIIVLITKKNLTNFFVLICIDNPSVRGKLPSFVTCVPTLVTNKKEVLVDDTIAGFLEFIKPKVDDSILPFCEAPQLTDSFSFIGDESDANMLSKDYVFIQETMRIETPKELEITDRSDTNMDSFISERQTDIQRYFTTK